jgi:uncharacterized protein HemY
MKTIFLSSPLATITDGLVRPWAQVPTKVSEMTQEQALAAAMRRYQRGDEAGADEVLEEWCGHHSHHRLIHFFWSPLGKGSFLF